MPLARLFFAFAMVVLFALATSNGRAALPVSEPTPLDSVPATPSLSSTAGPASNATASGLSDATSSGSLSVAAAEPVFPVVTADALIAVLPQPPESWKAEAPDGSTSETDDLKFTTAHRTYYKDADSDNAPTATLTIIDAGGSKNYLDATTAAWQLNSDTPDGLDKPVEIDGMRGHEHTDKPSHSSSLAIIVANRFFVQVELTNLDPQELRMWFARIDLKKLASLK